MQVDIYRYGSNNCYLNCMGRFFSIFHMVIVNRFSFFLNMMKAIKINELYNTFMFGWKPLCL